MTPSNPDNNKPFIYRIADALGINHLVVAVQHSHLMSEISGLIDALAGKMDTMTIDSTPTANSTNLVTSGGVKAALDGKANTSHTHNHISYSENNEVSIGDGYLNIRLSDSTAGTGGEVDITVAELPNMQRALQNPDSVPTAGSNKLVTSSGVEKAIIPTIVFSSELDSLKAGSGTHSTYIVLGDPHLGECILFLSYTQGRFITYYQILWGPAGVKTRSARESEEYGEWSIRTYTMSEE